jgi:endonuclease/exonuclease/phosphatase family metal-dependent hydrolase
MQIRLLTYNLCFNRAKDGLKTIISQYQPDIICLQEIETREENLTRFITQANYALADYSNCFIKHQRIYGVATYYNQHVINFADAESFDLPRSFLENFLVFLRGFNNPRTVLKTKFLVKKTSQLIYVYNTHLSPFASNGARKKQMEETLADIHPDSNTPTIITGDFNFPYGRKKLQQLIDKNNLQEATNKIRYTFERRFFYLLTLKLKDDYIFYRQLKNKDTFKIPLKSSDHYPILAIFEI